VTAASVTATGVGVRFLFDRQRRIVSPTLARLRRKGTETWGLRDVSFEIGPGEGVALIGRSGSGKTTLLRAMAGVMPADEGSIAVEGGVGSLLSIQAGLMGILTGRENSELLGVLTGLSRARSRAIVDDVRERSGLDDAFDRPVASYSQGMRAKLGLAVAEENRPSVLLLDEVHEALDHEYRAVLDRHAEGIVERGGIVVAAGHDHPMLERLCTRALLLDDGRLVQDGPFEDVRRAYLASL
jgi:ABC-type polysaccharide/polyol phosphate transport system ATPase subunit